MPLFVIVTSGDWAFTLLSIWLAGCCLLLLYKIAEHLVFRRRILRGAVEAEPEAQALFIEELELAQFRGRRPLLLRSGAVAMAAISSSWICPGTTADLLAAAVAAAWRRVKT